MSAEKTNDRILYIDSFRGIAALGVAWFHIFTAISNPFSAESAAGLDHGNIAAVILNYLAVWGRWGVHLFFIISGFVLAHSLQRRYLITSLASVGRYLIRRSVRLDPTYWFVLLLTLAALAVADDRSFLHLHAWKINSFVEFLTNAFYINSFVGHQPVISVSWTLAIEIQLYIFFAFVLYIAFLLMRLAKTTREKAVFIVLMVVAVFSLLWHFVPFFNIPVPFLTSYFFIFIMGVLLYNASIDKTYLPMLAFYALVIGLLFIKQHDSSLMAIMLFSVLIFGGHHILYLRKRLENKYLLYFGKLSYCIYLLHVPVGLVTATYIARLGTQLFGFNLSVHFFSAVFSVVATVLASHVVNKFIEEKTIGLSKKIAVR